MHNIRAILSFCNRYVDKSLLAFLIYVPGLTTKCRICNDLVFLVSLMLVMVDGTRKRDRPWLDDIKSITECTISFSN